MFVSLAYSIYMVSTTPLLDFKQRYKVQLQMKEHARFKYLAPYMYYTLYTIRSKHAKKSKFELLEL